MASVKSAGHRLAEYQAELAKALAEVDTGAVASDSARHSVRAQLQAGVPATAILDDAANRWELDTVRAVRAEVGGVLMATAGADQHARTMAAQGRDRAELAADRVLARLGSGEEADVAKLRLGSVVLVESARQLAQTAGVYAVKGELDAQQRMTVAYAQADANRALEGSVA